MKSQWLLTEQMKQLHASDTPVIFFNTELPEKEYIAHCAKSDVESMEIIRKMLFPPLTRWQRFVQWLRRIRIQHAK